MRAAARFVVRHPWRALIGVIVAAAAGGFAVTASGVIPIKASSRHWAATEWLLHFAMRRSVATHALLAPQPPRDFDTAAMVLRGAGHFETGCRPCHGGPKEDLPPIPHAMTPQPPELSSRIQSWSARELFYIVKHGVKFTGMPAWPASGRDDEVWAMVAFLRRMPALDAAGYEALVHGGSSSFTELSGRDVAAESPPRIVAERCARCHGMDGTGPREGAFPKLAGQRLRYLEHAMEAYATGRRFSGIMQPIAAGLQAHDRDAALRYYAGLSPVTPAPPVSEAAIRGARIAALGVANDEIPSCNTCHANADANDAYPRLTGQYRDYIMNQLTLLKSRARGGSDLVHIMRAFVDRLEPAHIEDLAEYYASSGGEH